MMHLNPRLASLLETYEPERLKALLLWFNADAQSVSGQSQRLHAILDETLHMDMDACYQAASQLQLDDMVHVSILNEFGPEFAKKAAFQWLNRTMTLRLAQSYPPANPANN